MAKLSLGTPADLAAVQTALAQGNGLAASTLAPNSPAATQVSVLNGLILSVDAASLPQVNGETILLAPDDSGSGNHMYPQSGTTTKETDAKGPLIKSAGGRLRADFGGGLAALGSVSAPASFMVVAKLNATQSQTFPSILTGSGTNPFALLLNMDPSQDTNGSILASNGSIGTPSVSPQATDGNVHAFFVMLDGQSAAVYMDGYLVNASTAGNFLSTPLAQMLVGQAQGDYRAIRVWNRKITAPEISYLTEQAAAKYGVPYAKRDTLQGAQIYTGGSTADGSTYRLWRPAKRDPRGVLVLFAHQQGGNEKIVPGSYPYAYVTAATSMGWYVGASSMGLNGTTPGGSDSSWGNATALNSLLLLHNLVNAEYPITKVILLGASMGGFANANAIQKGALPNVVGTYSLDAAYSLWEIYKLSGYYAGIDAAYATVTGTLSGSVSAGATSLPSTANFSAGTIIAVGSGTASAELVTVGPGGSTGTAIPLASALVNAHASGERVSDYGTKTAGWDAMLAPVTNYAGKRARFKPSPADTIALKSLHTTPYQARVAPVALESVIADHKGLHLGGGVTDPADFIEFAVRCLS